MTSRCNYYTALLFKQRPDLHMTLQYYANKTPDKLAKIITDVHAVVGRSDMPFDQFKVKFDQEDWFGPKHTVRVLRPANEHTHWPVWVQMLIPNHWAPHVSTVNDRALTLEATDLVIMSKKREIVRWPLGKKR